MGTIFYWLFWALLLLIIVIVVFYFLIPLLICIDVRMDRLRDFTKKNDSFFSLFFIGLFGIEQVLLIMLLFIFGSDISLTKLIVSVFALVVISTASLQKHLLETKRRYEREHYEAALKVRGVLKDVSEILSQKVKK